MSGNTKLPIGWVLKKLKHVTTPKSERVSPIKFPDVPYIGLEHVQSQTMKLLGTISSETMKSSSTRFSSGDVLYSRLRPYLNKVYHADFSGLCSAEFIVLPQSDLITSSFLKYRLNSHDFVSFASHLNSGDRPRVDFEQIGEFEIVIPPLPEQHRIVAKIEELFSELDAGVAALERARANLKRYRASLLKAAVEGKLTEEWRANNPDTEPAPKLLARILKQRREKWQADQQAKHTTTGKTPPKGWQNKYVEPTPPDTTNLPELPEGWCWATADQLSDAQKAITYGIVKLGDPVDHGVPTLRSSNVRNLLLELEEVKQVSHEIANQYKRTFLEGGELLFTVRGTLGGIAVAPDRCKNWNVSREIAVLLPVDKRISLITAMFVASPPIQRWLFKNTRGITYMGVNIETLKELPIPLVSLAENVKLVSLIEEGLSQVSAAESAIKQSLQRAARLRQSILKRAFEGKLVPQDPNDAPASVSPNQPANGFLFPSDPGPADDQTRGHKQRSKSMKHK